MDSTMMTILVVLMVTTLAVSILLGTLAKLTVKELATQTLYMVTAGLVFFGLVALLPGPHR
ncbi:MAG: hypothetical protein OEU54_05270 [Gemmatimonadota bacterium]|nr:hypothetical protein [Gemmatimonadota bacterium]